MRALAVLATTLTLVSAKDLPRSSPEAQGISSAAIKRFMEAADEQVDAMHSLMLVRHGHVVTESWWAPYSEESPHQLFSLSKSFTSTAVGLAINEGRLSLHDPILKFFPEAEPSDPSRHLRSMRVSDLLTMSTGHDSADLKAFSFTEENLVESFLALPVAHKPGTHFLYNTPATYMCSAILQKLTGEPLLDYLKPRLFDPLGIDEAQWATSLDGVSLGGFGLKVKTSAIAKLGQLYLQKGTWQGKQLLPAEWVEAATARQASNGSHPNSDWEQGYGYQFWRCRHGAYRGDGAFGQFCIVMPEQDAVIAITSGTRNMGGVMDLVWKHLLPAMKPDALPVDEATHRDLSSKATQLALPMIRGEARSDIHDGVSYRFPSNESKLKSLTFEKGASATNLIFTIADQEHRIDCGHLSWSRGLSGISGVFNKRMARWGEQPVAASGAWTSADTYEAQLWFTESPFGLTLKLNASEDEVVIDGEFNAAFGPRKLPILTGKKAR